ncbi:SDR family NAD(P)-dependent oxidoreductase [Piscinibacter sakaiensis]|uniref:SDR family NAD(P)-dependent oxidoreductase n=1 Tax=Piscinibacter sakaiensis TaxID=1547922 RepID=UPI003AAD69CD
MNTSTQRPVAIVTGACGALGSAITERLAEDGMHVVLADLDIGRADALASKIPLADGQQLLPARVDMGDNASIAALVALVGERFGRIDNLVNNAAVNHRGSLRDFDPDKWDHMMAVNLRGPAVLCQQVIPYWERQQSGSVVNIASRAWVAGGPPAYAAGKAGVVGLTRSIARELAPFNVTANAVAPGLIPSAFTMDGRSEEFFGAMAERQINQTPLGRLATPQDVANTVAFLLSPGAAYITAEVIHVCGGSQLAPLGGANK